MQTLAPHRCGSGGRGYTRLDMRRPRLHGSIAFAGALLVLLAVLAALQYRWIGELSRAERQRLETTLEASAERFAADFDLEVTRVFAAFALDPRLPPAGREAQLRERHAQWLERAGHPRLLRELLLASRGGGAWTLRRFDDASATFEGCPWPDDLVPLRAGLDEGPGWPRGPGRRGMAWPVLGRDPTLIVPAGFGEGSPALVLLRLDRAYVAGTLLPELAARHFGLRDELEYDVAVVRRNDPADVIYRSDPGLRPADMQPAEAGVELLAVRPFAELHGLMLPWPGAHRGEGPRPDDAFEARGPRPAPDEDALRRPRPAGPRHERPAGPARFARRPGEPRGGAWLLLVRPRGGSLEALVARTRTRNLALSAGTLSLLALSVVLLAASTRRAHGLARQQMEFVAGVTHELHTPLAGIRSAAQNLKDGVVAEPGQVRRYGGLIEKESRRLSDMLQQVLDFAGIRSGRRALRRARVELRPLIEEALASCRFLIEEQGVSVEAELGASLPAVDADPAALRAALRNVIQNAAKYGGGWLRVSAEAKGAAAEIRVEDRGPGIAAADRAHIFEPFYRGENAAAGQAPGSGLGLSIVKDVIEAHGGRVEVRARPEGGSCFTLRLPTAAGEPPEAA